MLILSFPSMPGPYFTTVSGIGLILAGFLAHRPIKKDNTPKEKRLRPLAVRLVDGSSKSITNFSCFTTGWTRPVAVT